MYPAGREGHLGGHERLLFGHDLIAFRSTPVENRVFGFFEDLGAAKVDKLTSI